MPVLGTIWADGDGGSFHDSGLTNIVENVATNKATNGGADLAFGPVIPDYTVFNTGLDTTRTLRDIASGQDWRLRSIVGQISLVVTNGGDTQVAWNSGSYWKYVQCCVAFFVARAQDGDQSLPDLTIDEMDPFIAANSRNPWIWRRTWLLANPFNSQAYTDATGGVSDFHDELYSNRDFGSEGNGTVIRTKSVRRIKTEERLWYVLAACGWNFGQAEVNGTAGLQPGVGMHADLRVFGQLAPPRGRSTF